MSVCLIQEQEKQTLNEINQCEQGYFGRLDYRMIRHIAQYLSLEDIINFRSTNSVINQLIHVKLKIVEKVQVEFVQNDNISLYLGLNIEEIYKKIIDIVVIIQTKDQGWATVPYSCSWVTLSLFNEENDYRTYLDNQNEFLIHSNYKVPNFIEIRGRISDWIYESITSLIRKGKYANIGIVQKCRERCWECFLRSAKMIIYYLE